jgi:tRNA (guanine26-N2/guanine27-N2)-dimethyltransferase
VHPAREGGTELSLPDPAGARGPAKRRPVFYNGAMSLDRDLHVAVAAAWAGSAGRKGSAWEMLAATGVRGLRVLVETGALDRLVSTDAGGPAAEVLGENARRYADRGATSLRWDARRPVSGGPFDHVDLDPFGSPLPYLDAALDALAPSGLLSVTATDMIVLAGVDASATRRRYDAVPVQGRLGPEGGLRILMRTISDRAQLRGRSVRPLVGYLRDHYVRLYAVVGTADEPPPVSSLDPDRWDGPTFRSPGVAGPLWVGALFDRPFVERLQVSATAANPAALARLIERFREESVADVPFYYEPNTLARDVGLPAPASTDRLVEALRERGHPSGRTHARDGAFRTRATRAEVYAVARTLGADPAPPRTGVRSSGPGGAAGTP